MFTGAWPRGGVSCAGPKLSTCETISRAGYQAAWAKQGYCSRCASQSAYRERFSEANLQHLGPRDEALSSLLTARVHPVISVVTLTTTVLLCYAGYVCNYYVKIME